MHHFLTFILFCSSALHVSGGLSIHHQESKTVHTASDICQTSSADYLLAGRRWNCGSIPFPLASSQLNLFIYKTAVPFRSRQQVVSRICLTYIRCCMYSLRLLMMDGETVRNMQSVVPKYNKFEILCIWLVLVYKYITMHGHTSVKQTQNVFINNLMCSYDIVLYGFYRIDMKRLYLLYCWYPV